MGDCSSACGGPIHHEQSECTGNHQRHRLNSSTGTDSDEADTRPTPPPSEQGSTSSFLEARPQSRSVNTPQGAVQQTLQNFGWPLPKRTRDDNSVVGGAVTTNLPAGSSTRVFEQANAGVPSARRPQRHRPNQNTIPRSSTNGNSAGFVVTPGTTCVHWSDDVGTPGWQPQGASMRAVERGAGCREEHRRYGDRSSLDDERREERQLRGTAVMFVAVYNAVEALARTTPAFLGLTLLAGSIATGVNRNIRLLILIIIILGTTSFSWCAAFPPPPPPNAVCSTPLGGPSYLHGFWVTAPPVPPAPRTKGEAAVAELERGIWLWRKMFSVRKLVAGLMALACLPSLLDALAQVLFYRLASRASNGWLTLAFGVSSALYCGFVLTRVAGQGPAALNSCMQYRFLQLSRQVLFSAAMALAVRRDWRLLSWYSSVGLLATATVFLSAVSARAAERSVRYGLAVALEEVLGNVQHEVSTESMLYLAFWRWLVDFWSQRFQFSKADMRIMLLHAAAAIEKQHRPPRVARVQHESGHGDVTSDGAQVAGGRPSTEMRKSVSGLARWLGGARTAGVGDLVSGRDMNSRRSMCRDQQTCREIDTDSDKQRHGDVVESVEAPVANDGRTWFSLREVHGSTSYAVSADQHGDT